jgi:hypothetical protein
MPGTYCGVEIVRVIAKNFNPINRAEFNPGLKVLHVIGP